MAVNNIPNTLFSIIYVVHWRRFCIFMILKAHFAVVECCINELILGLTRRDAATFQWKSITLFCWRCLDNKWKYYWSQTLACFNLLSRAVFVFRLTDKFGFVVMSYRTAKRCYLLSIRHDWTQWMFRRLRLHLLQNSIGVTYNYGNASTSNTLI